MKNISFPSLLLFCLVLLQSCIGGGDPQNSSAYKAIKMPREDFEQSVKLQDQENTVDPGKIYVKDNLLFINDVNRGFHIYNYSDPANPVKIAFLKMPGATDIAIRDNILYVNQAVDLVAIDYDPVQNKIVVTNRTRNVFPQKISPDGFTANTSENQIITNWKYRN